MSPDPAVPTRPLQALTCPLCGGANDCTTASRGRIDMACWCRDAPFSAELLERVPEAQRGLACICRKCASAQ